MHLRSGWHAACGMFRASESIMDTVCSAAETVFPPGRVHDDDAPSRGGGNIDIVHARPGPPDDLEVRAGGDDLRRHLRGAPDQQRVECADRRQEIRRRDPGRFSTSNPSRVRISTHCGSRLSLMRIFMGCSFIECLCDVQVRSVRPRPLSRRPPHNRMP